MNETETKTLLSKMQVFWPQQERDDAQTALWATKLTRIRDFHKADEAVALLMEATPFWPHWSEFMRTYNSLVAASSKPWTAKPESDRKCPTCRDAGWLDQDEEARAVKPCPNCRSEQFDRWSKGAMTGRVDLDDWARA